MESSLAEKVGDIIQSSENTEIAFLPQFTGVDIRIISSDRVNMEKAQKSQEALLKEIEELKDKN